MKISHRELEECRRSPSMWWQRRQSLGAFRTFGYGQALLNAIHRYTGRTAHVWRGCISAI